MENKIGVDKKPEEMRPYFAIHQGEKIMVHGKTSLEAQEKAAAIFKARRRWDVDVFLADVEHSPTILGG